MTNKLLSKFHKVSSISVRILIFSILWLCVISILHFYMNSPKKSQSIIKMGYMPVITNLSAPILDHLTKDNPDIYLNAIKFSSFADMAEAFKADEIQVAFIIAPLAVVLYQQGVKLKIVYIGNRHESTLVALKDKDIKSFKDLSGKTIAVPIRYSGHNLFLHRLAEEHNVAIQELNIVEMQPPDMAAALTTGDLDAYCVGEPFAAQTIYQGFAKRITNVESQWKDFICNLVVLKEDFLKTNPEFSARFVSGLIRSGIWAKNNQKEAIDIVSGYWNQDTELIQYAFKTPPGRIRFDLFSPAKSEIQEIADLMYKYDLLEYKVDTKALVDSTYAQATDTTNVTYDSIF